LDTKTIALTIVFAAVTIALTPISVPAGFIFGYFYRFWDIPIVVAFLLFGPRVGVTVDVLRALAELTLLPGPTGLTGPPTALAGSLAMLLGVYVAGWLLKRKSFPAPDKRFGIAPVTVFAALGTLFRASFAPFIMYPVYRFFAPRAFTDAQILILVPGIMLFAAILALYTIVTGYLIAKTINRSLGVGNKL
jgi:riboflavin transporter FmnP